jgi:xanthine dehydrogenase YagT iron-sulfur-binding subunit
MGSPASAFYRFAAMVGTDGIMFTPLLRASCKRFTIVNRPQTARLNLELTPMSGLATAQDTCAPGELQFSFPNQRCRRPLVEDVPEKKKRNPAKKQSSGSGVSRRDFLKISGISAAVPLVSQASALAVADQAQELGPGKVPLTLSVNGKKLNAQLEPRVTLLDALRDQFDLTGAKRVCDRGTCGACTVLMDNKAVYSCSLLAIDAQGHEIRTVEGLGEPGRLHPIQQAFVDNDAQQCGFCTPGFVMATKAFLDQHPHPTPEQIKQGLGGNFCRCGTYAGMRAAVLQAAKSTKGA